MKSLLVAAIALIVPLHGFAAHSKATGHKETAPLPELAQVVSPEEARPDFSKPTLIRNVAISGGDSRLVAAAKRAQTSRASAPKEKIVIDDAGVMSGKPLGGGAFSYAGDLVISTTAGPSHAAEVKRKCEACAKHPRSSEPDEGKAPRPAESTHRSPTAPPPPEWGLESDGEERPSHTAPDQPPPPPHPHA